MQLIELLSTQVKDRARPSQCIRSYDKVCQGVPGLRRVAEAC